MEPVGDEGQKKQRAKKNGKLKGEGKKRGMMGKRTRDKSGQGTKI